MPMMKYHLIHWLRDAYAMELQSIEVLERQCTLAHEDYALEKRLAFHLEETRDQAEKMRMCLEQLGSNTSGIKMGLSRLVGNMHAITTALQSDDKVKSMIINMVFEQFEIGCYEALIVAATEARERDIADICRKSMAQERLMEMWLEKHLPDLTKQFLQERHMALHAPIIATPGKAHNQNELGGRR